MKRPCYEKDELYKQSLAQPRPSPPFTVPSPLVNNQLPAWCVYGGSTQQLLEVTPKSPSPDTGSALTLQPVGVLNCNSITLKVS